MKKNSLTLILMSTSILLLLILQVFWLRSSYRDASDNFRKETNSIFRNVIFAMHDSLIQRSIEPVEKDSLNRKFKKRIITNERRSPDGRDTVMNYYNFKERTARIEIISSDEGDSVGKFLRPLISRLQMQGEPKNFILRLGPDSLQKDSIKFYFSKALNDAGIATPFSVITYNEESRGRMHERVPLPSHARDIYQSDVVRLNPFHQYAVSFTGINLLLLKEITPQILFSLFLTIVTVGSFYTMYRSLRSQQRLMEIKNDFISNVTHELKTPVATVSVALEALKNFNALDDPKRTSEYLEIAQNELNRLTLMTDKILKTAVYEDHGVDAKMESVNLDELISQVLTSMKLVFEKRRTQLHYSKTGSSFTVQGSKAHLTNVLYNLVDNALKYSAEGSHLEISLIDDDTNIILNVKDNGIGIQPEYQKKIFEKFFRVPSGDVHNTKGYGLGLSYVASVVKSHRGEITVESEPHKGSSFNIVLPVGQH